MKFFAALMISSLLLIGCAKEESDDQEAGLAASVAAGEKLFSELCASCHPRSGRGDYLKRIPATLLTRRSNEELIEWIRGRDQHREMPSFDYLSDEELSALADFLKAEIDK